MKRKRAALYARVSTEDKHQSPEFQLRALREYAKSRDFEGTEFVVTASGRKATRPEYQKMLAAVHKRALDIVLVWRYDRFARSTRELINQLEKFKVLGVDFVSITEGTDTTTPQGKLFFTLISGFAEFESELIAQRVRAGMAEARTKGKHLGRPQFDSRLIKEIKILRNQKLSFGEIAKQLNIGKSTAIKYAKKSH
jgi:DNA invertase Pin-like site-specific DNA recombinase